MNLFVKFYLGRTLFVAVMLSGLILGGCAPLVLDSVVHEGSEQPIKLKVLLLPYLGFAPFFIAEEEGHFADNGLEVEFVRLNRSSEAIPALSQGDMDVAVGSLSVGMLNAISQEGQIKVIANKGRYDPDAACTYAAILASKDLVDAGDLAEPADLQGRRMIILSPAGVTGYLTEQVLQKGGLTLDDVEIVGVPPASVPEALQNGAADAAFAGEPWVSRILQTGKSAVLHDAKDILPNFDISYILFGPSLLEENPEAGQRFMTAYMQSVQQYNEGKTARNLDIVEQYTELDRELLEAMCWLPLTDDASVNMEQVNNFQMWAIEKGFLDERVTEQQFWDPTVVESVVAAAETQ